MNCKYCKDNVHAWQFSYAQDCCQKCADQLIIERWPTHPAKPSPTSFYSSASTPQYFCKYCRHQLYSNDSIASGICVGCRAKSTYRQAADEVISIAIDEPEKREIEVIPPPEFLEEEKK